MQLKNDNESTGDTDSDDLRVELAQTNATADKILKDYKAYSKGKLLTGTMENYTGQTVTANEIIENGENAEITIPLKGYYETDSKVSIPIEKIKNNIDPINSETIIDINSTSWEFVLPVNFTSMALMIQGWNGSTYYSGGLLFDKKYFDFSKDFSSTGASLLLGMDARYSYNASSRKFVISSPFNIHYAIIH